MLKHLALIFILGLAAPVWPSPSGGLPGSFTRMGVGSRALSMAGSYAGIADDVTALYWNPAGLALVTKPELSVMHMTLFEDTAYDFAAFGKPVGPWGTVALGLVRQTSGGFEQRTNPFDAPTRFSIENSMYQLGWGVSVPRVDAIPGDLCLGATAKRVQQSIAGTSASSVGVDLGLLYRPGGGASLGVYAQNMLAPKQKFVSQALSYPLSLDISPAYTRVLSPGLRGTVALRANRLDNQTSISGGVELLYSGRYALRFGGQERGLSAGLGLAFQNYFIDYAVVLNEIAPSHMFSLGIRFGRTKEELEAEIKQGIQKFNEDEAGRLAKSYYQQGANYAKEGNYAKAVGYLESAALWSPNDRKIAEKLSEVKNGMQASIDKQLIERSAALAQREFERGNMLASREHWESVLQLDPDNAQAKVYIARIEEGFGSKERARLQAAQSMQRQAQVQQMVARAVGLVEEGRFREALQEARRVLKIDPENGYAKVIIEGAPKKMHQRSEKLAQDGLAAVDRKEIGKAAALFEQALQDDPQNAQAKLRLEECRSGLRAAASPETVKKIERLYFQAVDEYVKGDYLNCRTTLTQIFELDPANEAAQKLNEKVAVSSKTSTSH